MSQRPKTIMIVSQKGGVGKSTVAEEIAFSLDRTFTPYSYYDWDGQGGSTHVTHEVANPLVQIVDTPAGLGQETIDNLHLADLIVVTCKPHPRDVVPLERTLSIIAEKSTCPIIVVVTHFNERYRLGKEFFEYITGRVGAERVLTLPLTEAFPQSDFVDKSIIDYAKTNPAADATYKLVNRVRTEIGLPVEETFGASRVRARSSSKAEISASMRRGAFGARYR